tara:strand:- start:5530 stop:6681 length:1152 start_codon:yes stop_codon:yes gene_type:complete
MLTSFYNIDSKSATVGSWLQGKYIFYDNPKASSESARLHASPTEEKGRTFVSKLKHIVKQSAFMRSLLGIPIIFSQLFAIVRHGKRTIKKEQVEVLMGFSDYGPAIIGTYILHLLTKKPFMVFLFDVYKGNLYPFPGHQLAVLFEKRIMQAASKIVVTNEVTAEVYEKRYGPSIREKIVVIHNATPSSHAPSELPPYDPKEPYSIVFTGSVYWPQIGALRNLVTAIDGTNMHLKLYTPAPEDLLKKNGLLNSNVEFMGSAPFEDMPKIQGAADLLFLPLSWNTKSPVIIDTATPGKLTDYLIAGRPMLVHAPSSSCVVRYTKENDCALVVDEDSPEKLKEALDEFFANNPAEIGAKLVENAQALYHKNHDALKNTQLFRAILE